MSRTYSLVVLCPNGRRETVKVSSNNSILQVLEEACKKQNLNAGDYDIRHYNKTLDPSLPIRFANLPNNAQLELRKAENSRADSNVTVGLQLESGKRLMADFPPSASVSDVLKQCLSSESDYTQESGEPVCIYMRQKITGEALESTTLRSLGLTKGSAMIRLLYRKPEELEEQAHVSRPLTAPVEPQTSVSPIPEQIRKQPRLDNTMSAVTDANINEVKENWGEDPMEVDAHNVGKGADIWDDEEEEVCRSYRNPDVGIQNPDVKQPLADVGKGSEVCEEEKEVLGQNDLSDENTKMELSTEAEEEDNFEGVGDIKYIGERHAVVYSLDHITNIKKADLPDEFFDLTINDAKYLMSEYQRQRVEFENQPLLTKEQRQRQILQKLACYSQTVIRVYFPDKLVLQAVFDVTETIQAVSDFVCTYLDHPRLNFYLYITPPKEKLNPNKTLLEAMLVPAAVVYFGCESQLEHYLVKNLRNKLSDPRAAALAAYESRKGGKLNEGTSVDIPSLISSTATEEKTIASNVAPAPNASRPSSAQTQKVPAWLKLGKK